MYINVGGVAARRAVYLRWVRRADTSQDSGVRAFSVATDTYARERHAEMR
jgi:hypothetical protein